MKMTHDQLKEAGIALFGERWHAALARDLKVSDRTMRRWMAGQAVIPDNILREVNDMLRVKWHVLCRFVGTHEQVEFATNVEQAQPDFSGRVESSYRKITRAGSGRITKRLASESG